MKYCTVCGQEYVDSAKTCSDCDNDELVTLEEMRRRKILLAHERDTRKFVPAGTAEDPLSAERFSEVLHARGIPVFARARRSGTVDNITDGIALPWWEILVPEEKATEAAQLIEAERKSLEASAADAEKAAEEEEAAGEGQER